MTKRTPKCQWCHKPLSPKDRQSDYRCAKTNKVICRKCAEDAQSY